MKILELFCGLGGWSKGFHDIFPDAEFYGVDIKNYGYPYNFIKADLNDWEPKEKYDIVLASPPCNQFCEEVRSTGCNHYSERLGLSLVYRTFYLIEKIKPKFWVLENVWGLSEFIDKPKDIVRYGRRRCNPKSLRGGSKRAYLWGNFPSLGFFDECDFNIAAGREKYKLVSNSKLLPRKYKPGERAQIPLALSRQMAKKMKEKWLTV
jgi:site-specific DNA-cytosine methylase